MYIVLTHLLRKSESWYIHVHHTCRDAPLHHSELSIGLFQRSKISQAEWKWYSRQFYSCSFNYTEVVWHVNNIRTEKGAETNEWDTPPDAACKLKLKQDCKTQTAEVWKLLSQCTVLYIHTNCTRLILASATCTVHISYIYSTYTLYKICFAIVTAGHECIHARSIFILLWLLLPGK